MELDLLNKEKEYRELNKKLELRTKELLQEVDNVRVVYQKQQETIFNTKQPRAKFDPSKYLIQDETRITYVTEKTKSAPVRKPIVLLDPRDCKELALPEDVNNMGAKGLVHCLKAKAKKFQSDHQELMKNYRKKCDECKKFQIENQKLTEDKEKWLQNVHGSKNQVTKLEKQMTVLQSKLQTKDNELGSLRKEVDQLQKELKCSKAQNANLEIRLNRANDEYEKSKTTISILKQEEKDIREAHKKEMQEATAVLKETEKHKAELLVGFKKQLLIIDNLKKQKMLLECYKLSEKSENDFMKILDWKKEEN